VGKKKKGKVEDVAEKTGEAVGKGVKKGWGITKSLADLQRVSVFTIPKLWKP